MLNISNCFLYSAVKNARISPILNRRINQMHPRGMSRSTKKTFDKTLLKNFFNAVQNKNFDMVKDRYTEMVNADSIAAKKTYYLSALLSVCEDREQLLYGESIIQDSLAVGIPLSEAMMLPRIRLYCMEGQPERALEMIEETKKMKVELRLRDFAPIIDCYCSFGTVESTMKALDLVLSLQNYSMYPRLEQLTSIVKAARLARLRRDKKFTSAFSTALSRYRRHHYGIMQEDAVAWVEALTNSTKEDVESRGVLTSNVCHVDGKVISRDSMGEVPTRGLVKVRLRNPPVLHGGQSLAETTKNEVHATPTEYPPFSLPRIDTPQTFAIRGLQGIAPFESARIVYISQHDAQCPNCNMRLSGLMFEEWNKSRAAVKRGLADYFRATRQGQGVQRFEEFADFLENKRHYYDYVVDGANVGYFNQNRANGKFSFEALEQVYDSIKMKAGSDSRILVLLPASYSRDVRPNNALSGRGSTRKTWEDQRVLEKLKRADALHLVHGGGDDDLYAIYASLCRQDDRLNCTYVVTNDNMRNHKLLAFVQPRYFYQWRNLHQVRFEVWFERDRDGQMSQRVVSSNLFQPAPYVREILHVDYNKSLRSRWHLPILDSRSWLCLNMPTIDE